MTGSIIIQGTQDKGQQYIKNKNRYETDKSRSRHTPPD